MPCFIGQIWSRCSVLLAGRKDVLQYYANLILTCMIAYDPCQSHAFATKLWAENEATLFEQPHWQMRTVELLKIARGTAECVRYGTTEFKSAISVGSIPVLGCLSPKILAFVCFNPYRWITQSRDVWDTWKSWNNDVGLLQFSILAGKELSRLGPWKIATENRVSPNLTTNKVNLVFSNPLRDIHSSTRPFIFERENVLIIRIRIGVTLRSPEIETEVPWLAGVAGFSWQKTSCEGFKPIMLILTIKCSTK